MSAVARAEQPLDLVRPRLRGVSHAWAALAAAVVAVALLATADPGAERIAALVYGAGLVALFGGSGLYHLWPGDPRRKPLLRRIDHSTIFVFIAASYTPVALLLLHGTTQALVLGGVWLGALAGVTLSIGWIDAPRWLSAATYLALGWVALLAMPQLIDTLPAAPLALIAAGGVLYSIGAVVYATQRPDPWPATFGFHEVFHAFVIAAAATHVVAFAGWVFPG